MHIYIYIYVYCMYIYILSIPWPCLKIPLRVDGMARLGSQYICPSKVLENSSELYKNWGSLKN